MSRWLSPRQCEVLLHLAKGESFKWIASEMVIDVKSAEQHAARAYRKLGVTNRYDAVACHPWHKPTPSRECPIGIPNGVQASGRMRLEPAATS